MGVSAILLILFVADLLVSHLHLMSLHMKSFPDLLFLQLMLLLFVAHFQLPLVILTSLKGKKTDIKRKRVLLLLLMSCVSSTYFSSLSFIFDR